MGLSADDIVTYPLKQAVRGYSVPQVDELLDQVADTVERMSSELEDIRRRLRQSEDRLAEASETETTLKRTLVTAQRAAEQSLEEARERAAELVEEAQREAEAILEEARLDAEELRTEALKAARAEEADIRRRRRSLEGHIEALRIFEREYRTRLRGHLEEQLRTLEEVQHRADERPPELDEDVDDVPPIEPEHLGGATLREEGAGIRVRVRGVEDLGDEDPDGDEGLDAEGVHAGADDEDLDDDRTDDAGEVGSRAPDTTDGDEVRTARRRSVR